MQFVDTHCHIHDANYELDANKVVERAAQAGVTRLICVGTDEITSAQAVSFVAGRKECWASVGLHPNDADHTSNEPLRILEGLLEVSPAQHKIVAIGECGLDYFRPGFSRSDQERTLRAQIELALRYNLPLIFHIREAFDDFWPIFRSYHGLRGVLHSFTDSQKNLDIALNEGLYIGVNGIATFTKHDWQLEVFRRIPLENLLLETDAPYLTPTPHRGSINESAYVALVGDFLVRLRGEPLEAVATQTTQNAINLFSLV